MAYYVIEHDKRADGIVNTSETKRSTFALALSLLYERCSKLVADTQFVSAAVMLVDEDLNIKESKQIETSYVAPEVTTE